MAHVFGNGYVKTIQGILKICEILSSFIGILLIAINSWRSDLFNALIAGFAMALIISSILFILYFSTVGSNISHVLAYQLYANLFLFIYLVIVASIFVSKNYGARFTAGGAFGLISAVLYLVDAVDCYRNDKSPVFCV